MSYKHCSKTYVCPTFENQWIVCALIDKLETLQYKDKLIHTIKNALHSLTTYEVVINNKEDAEKVSGIKDYVAGFIEECRKEKEEKWQKEALQYLIKAATQNYTTYNKPKPNPKPKQNTIKSKKKDNNKEYVPQYKTGGWSILFAMTLSFDQYKQTSNDDKFITMTKQEIIDKADPFCKSDLNKMTSETKWTAWHSVKTLKKHEYVKQIGCNFNTKYELTQLGYQMGQRCIKQYEDKLKERYDDTTKENKANTPTTPIRRKKRKQVSCSDIPPLEDITNIPPPIKKRKMNDNYPVASIRSNPSFPLIPKQLIFDDMDKKWDLHEPIVLNGTRYKMYLVIDSREDTNAYSKRIKIYQELQKSTYNIPCKVTALLCGDFTWILQNIRNDEELYLLPFIIERKTYDDLVQSLKDDRYKDQKNKISFAVKNILVNGRKIYLIEGTIFDVKNIKHKSCKQAMVSTGCRDNYFVYTTTTKKETRDTLATWTYFIRSWIDNNTNQYDIFDFNKLKRLDIFHGIFNKKERLSTSREWFMRLLLSIDGVQQKHAYYITEIYPTIRCLYEAWNECGDEENKEDLDQLGHLDVWQCICSQINEKEFNFCTECAHRKIVGNEKKNEEKERMLLHNEVIYWKFVTKRIENRQCEADENILNCLSTLKQISDDMDDTEDRISKELSTKIWKQLKQIRCNGIES